MQPNLRQVKWIVFICFRFTQSHYLDLYIPFRKFFAVNSVDKIALSEIRILSFHFDSFIVGKVFDSLGGFEMKFYPYTLICCIEHTKCMAAKSVHMSVAIGGSAIRHQKHNLVQTLRIQTPEVPHHPGTLTVCIGITFLGMNKITEFFRVFNEKYRRIVSNQIPVSILSVKSVSYTHLTLPTTR